MKSRNNEHGYALLTVLMLVLLFTVLGMGLLAMNMNASKQFNLKEEQVQARHQAEMGVLHYSAILEDKVKSSSTSAISCKDIDNLLGTDKKLAVGDYIVEPQNTIGSSCRVIESGKKLKITIKSKGTINGDTKKEVEATFYATNQGFASTTTPSEGVNSPPAVPSSPDTKVVDNLSMKKETEVYNGNLIIKESLVFLPGNGNNLTIKKDLYISGTLTMQNHDCIATGGNFTALKSFNWGNSHTDILVRKDAYLPASIGGWKKDHTNLYIFGDLYLPKAYSYNIISGDRELYVGGKVYQFNSTSYVQISNPFKTLGESQKLAANILSCTIPAAAEVTIGTPKWVLHDEKIVEYQ